LVRKERIVARLHFASFSGNLFDREKANGCGERLFECARELTGHFDFDSTFAMRVVVNPIN
jgi:hypothetical protein